MAAKKQEKAGAPLNNKNAESWTYDEAKELFEKAYELSKGEEYDFIGEIAKNLGTYRHVFDYLKDKFPEFTTISKSIYSNLEANCFCHAKKGTIKEATAIVNLKSNYNWTDRTQNELTGANGSPLMPKKIQFVDFNDNE